MNTNINMTNQEYSDYIDKKETIDAIMMQVLSKYEEMNMND